MRATYSDYVVKKDLQTWLIMNVVFNMVEAWKPACGETSQYIKSHETVPTLQINYCIVEHVEKKKKDNVCSRERKSHIYRAAAFMAYMCGYCDRQAFIFIDLT